MIACIFWENKKCVPVLKNIKKAFGGNVEINNTKKREHYDEERYQF